jgi:hypothetical protein
MLMLDSSAQVSTPLHHIFAGGDGRSPRREKQDHQQQKRVAEEAAHVTALVPRHLHRRHLHHRAAADRRRPNQLQRPQHRRRGHQVLNYYYCVKNSKLMHVPKAVECWASSIINRTAVCNVT